MSNVLQNTGGTTLKVNGAAYGSVESISNGISSTSGTKADKQTLTITGTGFGTKTNAKPLYFWDGDDNTLNSSPLSRDAFTLGNTLDTSTTATNSTASMRFDYPTYPTITSSAMAGPFDTSIDGDGDNIVLFSKRRTNFDGLDAYAKYVALDSGSQPVWNHKLWRWWETSVSANNVDIGLSDNNANGNPRITPELTDGAHYTGNSELTRGIQDGAWLTELIRTRQGTLDTEDAYMNWMSEGKSVDYTFISKSTAYNNDYTKMYFPQAQFLYTDVSWSMWFDCFYLDDTQHSVFVSDASTWDETGIASYEICIPKTWSDTEITVQLRVGEFANYTGKYLYVIGADGLPISTTGYAL